MRWFTFGLGAAALFTSAACQAASPYCDTEGRCFTGYTNPGGVTYGIAIPEGTTAAPFDIILQVTAPKTVGWAGIAWGGAMVYNPLTLVWANGDEVVVSSRLAFGYFVPPAYAGATFTQLPGSGVNDTHFTATVLCTGCSSWDPFGDSPISLNPTGDNVLAFAYAATPVDDPASVDSTFSIHDSVGAWVHNLAEAQQADFDAWAGEGGSGGDPPPATTTTAPSSTPPAETATEPPASSAAPTGGAEPSPPAALPSACAGVTSFRFGFEVAEGWTAVKLAGSLRTPRGLAVDSAGNLLVVQSGLGLTVHTFGSDGCIASSKTLIANPALNHGIAFSPDGKTLYVSSMVTAWKHAYDAEAQTVDAGVIVVDGMRRGGHPTRTLTIAPETPNLLVVSVGSDGNFDLPSLYKETGRAIVKVFDMDNVPEGGYDYNTQGTYLGYGLRNAVALAVDGANNVWSIENSGDNFAREVDGQEIDIHIDNPAEEMNLLGNPSTPNEKWYGYPTCFTVWDPSVITDRAFNVGDSFIPAPNSTFSDDTCAELSVPTRLSIQAHSAPIDATFDADSLNMYVTLHGSWNRQPATGYKVVQVPFRQLDDGSYDPVAARDSKEGYSDIFWSTNVGSCTARTCFRPSGIVWDKGYTRMFVASDNSAEGELFILAKTS